MNAVAITQINETRLDKERLGAPVCKPSVMPASYKANRQLMLADFAQKSMTLGYIGEFTPHEIFYQDYFRDFQFNGAEHIVVVKANADKRKGEKRTMSYPSIRAMCEDVRDRTDSYVCPVSMFAPVARKALGSKIYAFVVDLDGVTAADLQLLIEKDFHGLKPTYIVNSGGGLHLVYVLNEPVRYFNYRKRALDETYKRIRDAHIDHDMSYKVDKQCGLIHSFRIAGSLTKIGTIAAAFKTGERWDIESLATEAGIDIPDEPPKRQYKTYEKKGVTPLPTKCSGWYNSTVRYIKEHVKQGYRHSSMFALMIIALKTRTRRDKLREDLITIRDHFNATGGRDKIEGDYPDYLMDYGKITIAQRVRRSTLEDLRGMEEYLGHGYLPCKRNGRKQADHLAMLATKKSKKGIVEAYLVQHPTASINEIANATGSDRKTVIKYRREIAASHEKLQEAVQVPLPTKHEESIAQPQEAPQKPPQAAQTQEQSRSANLVNQFTHEELVHVQSLRRPPDEKKKAGIRRMGDDFHHTRMA